MIRACITPDGKLWLQEKPFGPCSIEVLHLNRKVEVMSLLLLTNDVAELATHTKPYKVLSFKVKY